MILDVHLSGMSGLELQQVLADHGQRIPVVFVTAQEDAAGRLQAQALRARSTFCTNLSTTKRC